MARPLESEGAEGASLENGRVGDLAIEDSRVENLPSEGEDVEVR